MVEGKRGKKKEKERFALAFLALSRGCKGRLVPQAKPLLLGFNAFRDVVELTCYNTRKDTDRSLKRRNDSIDLRSFFFFCAPFFAVVVAIPTSEVHTNEGGACLQHAHHHHTAAAAVSCAHSGHDLRALSLDRCLVVAQ